MSDFIEIEGYPGYFISKNGDVLSCRSEKCHSQRILKNTTDKDGYLMVGLCKDGVPHTEKVHRLVAKAFLPNPYNRPQVNHKNGIKSDNRVLNLEWVTDSENKTHRYNILCQKGARTGCLGAKNPLSKPVVQIKNGIVIARFAGLAEASRKTGVHLSNIGECCRHLRKTARGFCWEFEKKEENIE